MHNPWPCSGTSRYDRQHKKWPFFSLLVSCSAHDLPIIPIRTNYFVRSSRNVFGGHKKLPYYGVEGVAFANRGGRLVEKLAHEGPGQYRSTGQVGRERNLVTQMGASLVAAQGLEGWCITRYDPNELDNAEFALFYLENVRKGCKLS